MSLALSADINERHRALARANEHGLNVERVAVVTAERTIEKAFEVQDLCKLRGWMLTNGACADVASIRGSIDVDNHSPGPSK